MITLAEAEKELLERALFRFQTGGGITYEEGEEIQRLYIQFKQATRICIALPCFQEEDNG